MAFTIWITEWRTGFRREMNEKDASSRARAVDSLLNFETVKYYGNEQWEVSEYERSIIEYQRADWKSSASLNLLNTSQNMIITIGVFLGLLICGKRVVEKTLTVGDFVAFITYLLQLYQPLNWFGTYYRVIQQNFIDMEKMMELLELNESIRDDPDASALNLVDGEITFGKSNGSSNFLENVSFSYNEENPVLKNISICIPAGKKVALVGSSGSGKTTLARLLFRFYDIQNGSIKIDGQDIRKVTQTSLRENIGVVPQDTVLFNDSIGFNIGYGRIGASQHEIEKCAAMAQIHDRILSFPQGTPYVF
jgi:ATP-binding cassette subfamily B (MDR/TAP) protein 6